MITPNLYTLTDEGTLYGLHRFKDGEVILAQQHASGDWINLRPARKSEVKHFEEHGTRVTKK